MRRSSISGRHHAARNHTHALLRRQSHSSLDNNMAFSSRSRARNCSVEKTKTADLVPKRTGFWSGMPTMQPVVTETTHRELACFPAPHLELGCRNTGTLAAVANDDVEGRRRTREASERALLQHFTRTASCL